MAGGIFFPLAKALCLACGSDPAKGTEKKMGAYVMKTCFQTSCISSAMFITAMAANPLAVNLASEALGQPISWGAWALAGIVPGLICLAAAPLILYVLYPPGKSLSFQRMASISNCCCIQRSKGSQQTNSWQPVTIIRLIGLKKDTQCIVLALLLVLPCLISLL